MTFTQFMKIKKGIDPDGLDLDALMEEFFEEYTEYLMSVKEGCSPEKI